MALSTRRFSIRRFLSAGLLLAAFALMVTACPGGQGGPPRRPTTVNVVTVELHHLTRTLAAVGSVESERMARLAAESSGRVVQVSIPQGEEVDEGHLLVQLDDSTERANLSIAQAVYELARKRLDRVRTLHMKNIVGQQELDEAIAAVKESEGRVAQARAAVDKTRITAPFAGRVGLSEVDPGDYLRVGDFVVRLTQVDPVTVRFSISERFLPRIAVGQPVKVIYGDCLGQIEGTVKAIEPSVDMATRAVELKAEIPNPEGVLRDGMSAIVRVQIDEGEGIVVPQQAVVRTIQGPRIYIVTAEKTAEIRKVRLGRYTTEWVEVVEGINAGETVITAGYQKLGPGAPVDPQPIHEKIENFKLSLGIIGAETTCEF